MLENPLKLLFAFKALVEVLLNPLIILLLALPTLLPCDDRFASAFVISIMFLLTAGAFDNVVMRLLMAVANCGMVVIAFCAEPLPNLDMLSVRFPTF